MDNNQNNTQCADIFNGKNAKVHARNNFQIHKFAEMQHEISHGTIHHIPVSGIYIMSPTY